eukprot:3353286-Pyramimonas_sp.AAC.1
MHRIGPHQHRVRTEANRRRQAAQQRRASTWLHRMARQSESTRIGPTGADVESYTSVVRSG